MHGRIIIFILVSSLLFGCSSDDKSPVSPDPLDFDYFVCASSGDDSNEGSQGRPFKTITYAVDFADTSASIKVFPGTYDETLGETFPIELKNGQSLVGDVDTKGNDSEPTLISGLGEFMTDRSSSFVGAEGSTISGFRIEDPALAHRYYAIAVDNVTMLISHNTIGDNTYTGIYMTGSGTTIIEYNVFGNRSYAAYTGTCPDGPIFRFNEILSFASIPISMGGPGTYIVITDNTITGSGQSGIQIQAGGHALIERNTFNAPGGYTYGAIRCIGSTATIRENTFLCLNAIRIDDNGNPDIGTAADPGQNSFAQVTGISLEHNGSETIYAIGNTWPNSPPLAGADIIVSGAGTVIYGTEAGDHIP